MKERKKEGKKKERKKERSVCRFHSILPNPDGKGASPHYLGRGLSSPS